MFESTPSYGIDSLVGEFGGWAGIFTGLALLTLFEYVTDIHSK